MNIPAEILTTQVALAACGGLTVNLLSLVELQNVPKERRPDFHDFLYWLPFFIWPILGALVGYVYNDAGSPLGKLVAFHIGLSTPLILRAMATVIPAQAKQQLPAGA